MDRYTSSLSVVRHRHVTCFDQADRSRRGMRHLCAEVLVAGAGLSIPYSPCHEGHKAHVHATGGAMRWELAGILSECKVVLWACSRFWSARNHLVLFMPQHNLAYSDFYSR